MDYYEKSIKDMLSDVKQYNYIEFWYEKDKIIHQCKDIKRDLEKFNIYLPKFQVNMADVTLAMNQIKIDLKDKINSYIKPTEHSFCLENYDYIINTHMNNEILQIYKQLGPFDFYTEVIEEDLEEKSMIDKFDKRKSGALYRGEIGSQSGKPDGRGFKVFPNGSIYEGWFTDGHTHGLGRGITSRGEVY